MMEKEIRLAELKQSISDMSDEELAARLNLTRNNRRPQPKVSKAKKAKKKKQPKDLDLSGISPELAKALLAKLQPSNDGQKDD